MGRSFSGLSILLLPPSFFYSLGTIHQQPPLEEHMCLILDSRFALASVPLLARPLYANFHEHHCLTPDLPLLPGDDKNGGDDILNAWLPRGFTIKHLEVSTISFGSQSGATMLSRYIQSLTVVYACRTQLKSLILSRTVTYVTRHSFPGERRPIRSQLWRSSRLIGSLQETRKRPRLDRTQMTILSGQMWLSASLAAWPTSWSQAR